MDSHKIPLVTLNNMRKMPQLGLGVWQIEEGKETEDAINVAFENGYRSIDTASQYGNEASVGRAVRGSGIPRDEVFVTTKLWNDSQGYDQTLDAIDESLERLGLDYVDLYLIHWPVPEAGKYVETWHAMEELYKQGKAKSIGISNFNPNHIDDITAEADFVPTVNQIQLHPHNAQLATRAYCDRNGIKVESYSPLMRGGIVLQDPVVQEIAKAHGKTPAQVVLRWHIQNGLIVIPKSATPERIKENIDIFDFELSAEQMDAIDGLDKTGQ